MLAVNFPFINSIHFEQLYIPNDEKLNKKCKHYFYHFINCRAYRDMNQIQNSYCYFSLDDHTLTIKANQNFIEICHDILNKFKNAGSVKIIKT